MNRAAFYAVVRKDLGALTQSQVTGFEVLLTAVNGLPVAQQAYLLATAWHETGATMQPVREAHGATDAQTIARLEKAWAAGKLKWVKKPYWRKDADGKSWFGRGYVQLTHKENYQKASDRMGIDLVSDPSAALSPMIAARVLVQGCTEGWFTGAKLSDFLPGNYVGARKVVNGTDRAQDIAHYAVSFEAALKAAEEAAPSPDVELPAAIPTQPAAAWWWNALWKIFEQFTRKWRV